jgi:hypothetical protein
MPKRPDLKQVGGAAGEDERRETTENPVKRQILPVFDKILERERNTIIGEGDEAVRDYMQPDDFRLPEIAVPMRQEIGVEQLRKGIRMESFIFSQVYLSRYTAFAPQERFAVR